jgi:hypothetical protein
MSLETRCPRPAPMPRSSQRSGRPSRLVSVGSLSIEIVLDAEWNGVVMLGKVQRRPGSRWTTELLLGLMIVLAACGSQATTGQHLAVLLGTAGECSGPANQPSRPVQVIVYRGSHVVVKQTKLGSHSFRFSLPPGTYRVTTDQSSVVPVNVVLRSGLVAHAAVLSAGCD